MKRMRNPFAKMTFLNSGHSWTRSFSARVRGFRKGAFDRGVVTERRKRLQELEASEACYWLRAAGFPQYAQLYEDGLFPIELSSVEVDHDFLDPDSIQSLYRRLHTLNKCAFLKVDSPSRKLTDDSDDEEQCALSDKWKYLRTSRRWSRKDLDKNSCLVTGSTLQSASSHDSVLTDPESVEMVDENQPSVKQDSCPKLTPDAGQKMKRTTSGSFMVSPRLRRAASEKIKSARNLIKRVESFKKNRSRKPPPEISHISQPVIVDSKDMQAKIQHLNCKEIKPQVENGLSTEHKQCDKDSEAKTANDVVSCENANNATLEHKTINVVPEGKKLNVAVDKQVVNEVSEVKSPTFMSGFVSASSEETSDNSLTSPEIGYTSKEKSMFNSSSKTLNITQNQPLFIPLAHTEMDSSTQAISTAARAAVENRQSRRSHRASNVTYSPEFPHRTASLPHRNVPQTYVLPQDYIPGSFPKQLAKGSADPAPICRVRLRTISGTNPADEERLMANNHRASVYDNVPTEDELAAAHRQLDLILQELFQDIDGLSQVLNATENETLDTKDAEETVESNDDLNLRLNTDKTLPTGTLYLPVNTDKNVDDSPNNQFSAGSLGSPTSPSDLDISLPSPLSLDQDDMAEDLNNTCPSIELDNGECDNDSVNSPGEVGTLSSHGECGTASSHDASEPEGNRERRDSGVGSSLTRAPSDRRRTRIRWHSFQKSHRPSFNSRNLQIENFSAGQLMVLRKLSLLKLTAIMEKYSPVNRTGWNWVVNRLIKRSKNPDYKDKTMFGVPLLVTLQRTGQPIPQCLLYAMRFLRKTSKDAVGIFRKSGVRSRIQKLRTDLELKPDLVETLDELQAYDVADLLKQYFRELPECLLTTKLSETFISIFTYVPADLRLEALQSAVILMPDENREVLQSLLLFLSDIALSSNEHQMTASNLAVCFAPSLFAICGPRNLPPTASPRTKRSNNKGLGVPDQKELLDQKAAHECLTMMIKQCKQLFMISGDTFTRCRFSYMEEGEPVSLEELLKTDELSTPDVTDYVDSCIKGILKEAREKFKNWTALPGIGGVDLAYKKVGDGHPLRLWKCSVEVEAPPTEVLNRILSERYLWDEDLLQWRTVEKINSQTDVFQYVRNSMAPHPTRDYSVLRSWRTDLAKGACVLVSTSIDHPSAPQLGGVRGVILASRFLIEPCGSGKSRVTHLSRIDMRGKGPEWYVKVYGHICSNFMCKIKASFTHADNISEGPETKV